MLLDVLVRRPPSLLVDLRVSQGQSQGTIAKWGVGPGRDSIT